MNALLKLAQAALTGLTLAPLLPAIVMFQIVRKLLGETPVSAEPATAV